MIQCFFPLQMGVTINYACTMQKNMMFLQNLEMNIDNILWNNDH